MEPGPIEIDISSKDDEGDPKSVQACMRFRFGKNSGDF